MGCEECADSGLVERLGKKVACRACSVPRAPSQRRTKVPTLNSGMSPAALCRANGWKRGTVLRGIEDYGNGKSHTDEIIITAIGERSIFARRVTAGPEDEGSWTLDHRQWQRVSKRKAVRGA